MTTSKWQFIAKMGAVLAAVPAVIIANSTGAIPGVTGAPGEQTCAQAGCHVGIPVNGGGGRVELSFSGGTSYTPGQRGTVTVTITDTNPRYGFSASARLSASNGQAGTLTAGTNQQVETASGIQYITHRSPSMANRFEFDWTAPAAGSGEVKIYVAANAANGNGQPTGDRIYTTNLTLTAVGNRPVISQLPNGVAAVSDSFNGQTGLASSAWISIYGQNLAPGTKTWDDPEFAPLFAQGRLPQTIDGVSVTVRGLPASVYFVSPGQINVLAPLDPDTGEVPVVVKTAAGESTPMIVRKTTVLPAAYAPFAQGDRRYVTAVAVALGSDGRPVYLGKRGTDLDPRVTRGVRGGETIQLFATGLGPTNPAIATDRTATENAALVNPPSVRIMDVPVTVLGSALVAPGLYQLNLLIPLLPAGDHPLVIESAGVRSASNVFITVE